jgi:hypothetical protein
MDNYVDNHTSQRTFTMIPSKKTPMDSDNTIKQDALTPQNVEEEAQHVPPKKATAARPELQSFVDALSAAMAKHNLTASDLARAVWGTTKDTRGYEVAKGRDRIGYFLRGVHFPDQKNLQKLARAVGLTVEELARGTSYAAPWVALAAARSGAKSAGKLTEDEATEDKATEDKATAGKTTTREAPAGKAKTSDPFALAGPLQLLRVHGEPDKLYVLIAEPLDIKLAKEIAALVLSSLGVEPLNGNHNNNNHNDNGGETA